jgi:hypothetical protein
MSRALKAWSIWLAGWILVGAVVAAIVSLTPLGRDNSDQGEWGARSGLIIKTDALTGCEYLATTSGGLSPRLTQHGYQVGCRKTGVQL